MSPDGHAPAESMDFPEKTEIVPDTGAVSESQPGVSDEPVARGPDEPGDVTPPSASVVEEKSSTQLEAAAETPAGEPEREATGAVPAAPEAATGPNVPGEQPPPPDNGPATDEVLGTAEVADTDEGGTAEVADTDEGGTADEGLTAEPERVAEVAEPTTVEPVPHPDSSADESSDAGDEPRPATSAAAAWRRLIRMGEPRPTKANVLSALLAVLLGIGIATQVQLTNARGLDGLSQSDLVRVLDDVSVRASKLDDQVRELEDTRDRLKSGTGSMSEAIAQAQKRVDTLGILAGVIPAHGPGIRLTISDPERQITGPIVLDLIQELRDAGAESIEVGGVRVVASSFVNSQDGEIFVDNQPVTRPIVVKAIGSSKTMASAMTIPGGVVETVRQKRASASVTEVEDIEITSVHQPTPLRHAVPVK